MSSDDRQRRRELRLRRENEKKDLEVERKIGPRPLEGMAGGHTTWTGEQDDRPAREVYGSDEANEAKSRRHRTEEQIPDVPAGEP
jgi:hypothetical protein